MSLSDAKPGRGANAFDDDARAALEVPFLVRVERDCSFREIAFDPTTQIETRKKIEGLLRSMEVAISPVPSAQWVSHQNDGLGIVDVTYSVANDATTDGIGLTRQKTRYDARSLPKLPPQFGGKMHADIVTSQGRVVVDPEGQFVRTLDAQEHVRIRLGKMTTQDVKTDTHVSRLSRGEAPLALANVNASRFLWGAPTSDQNAPRDLAPVDPALAALDIQGAIADFAGLLGVDRRNLHVATDRLAAYFRAHPEAMAELIARIKRGDVDASLHSALFLALEKTGTLAAERVLGEALADRGLSVENRLRAAAALQDIPRPSAQTARTLIDQSTKTKNAADADVARAALLSLGTLSHRTEKDQPEITRLARERLSEQLTQAGSSEDATLALDAVGNSGDAALAKSLDPFMMDTSATVRAHAAQAYGSMPLDTAAPVLKDWLGREQDPRVRRAITESIDEGVTASGKPANADLIAMAVAALPIEANANVRAALIRLLGSAVGTDASAKAALVSQFHREQLAQLKVLIGQFLSADDLR
jgi:hypothetical protein